MSATPITAERVRELGFSPDPASTGTRYQRATAEGRVTLQRMEDGTWMAGTACGWANGGYVGEVIRSEADLRSFCQRLGVPLDSDTL